MAKRTLKLKSAKISFQNDYYSDLSMDNMLYAKIVRSQKESGIVTSISAGDLPEGYSFYTARDVPGNNLISTPYGKVPVFSEGNISYKGEPLGILVGPDENKVIEYADDIKISYDENTIETYLQNIQEDENPVSEINNSEQKKNEQVNVEEESVSTSDKNNSEQPEEKTLSEKTESVEVQEKIFSNILASRKLQRGPCFETDEEGKTAGIDSVFKNCAYVVENAFSDALHTPVFNEPNGALCYFSGEFLTVYTPTQWLSDLRRVLCEAMHLEEEKIIIKKTMASGRGTNNIWYNSYIATQAAVAAYHTGSSIKLAYTREEQELFMETMLPITIAHKTGVDENGKIIAMQISIDVDAGASNPFIQEILDRLVIGACGCYNPLNVSITATAYSSSNPPSSIELQMIDTSAFFAVENQIYSLSLATGLTPFEIKKANIVSYNHDKYQHPFAMNYINSAPAIDALIKLSDFNRKYSSYYLNSLMRSKDENQYLVNSYNEAPLRGIGLSCGFEGSGYYGSGVYSTYQTMEITFGENSKLTIHSPPPSASIKRIWEQTAASILNIPVNSISINSEYNAKEEPVIPETIYSNVSIMTNLLKKCCESMVRKLRNTKPPITIRKNFSATQKKLWDSKNFTGTPFHNNSFAAAAVEIELDQSTFREKIRGIWIVINGGKILNPQAAETTIKLCIQKVLNSVVEDSITTCNNIHISFIQSNDDAYQIGELVNQVIPSAYTQAISQALGCIVNKLPVKTDALYNFYQEKLLQIKAEKLREEQRAIIAEGKSDGDEGKIAGDEGMITGDEGIVAGDEEIIESDEGKIASDENNIAGDEGMITGDEGIVAGDEGKIVSEEGIVAGDEGIVAGDEEMIAGDEENISTDENNIAGDEENISTNEEIVAGDEGIVAGDEEIIVSDEGMIAGDEENISTDENNIAGDEGIVAGDEEIIASDERMIAGDEENISTDENNIAGDEENISAEEKTFSTDEEKNSLINKNIESSESNTTSSEKETETKSETSSDNEAAGGSTI